MQSVTHWSVCPFTEWCEVGINPVWPPFSLFWASASAWALSLPVPVLHVVGHLDKVPV